MGRCTAVIPDRRMPRAGSLRHAQGSPNDDAAHLGMGQGGGEGIAGEPGEFLTTQAVKGSKPLYGIKTLLLPRE